MRRRTMLLTGVGLCMLGTGVAIATAIAERRPQAPRELLGPRMPADFAVGDFRLRDQDGRPYDLGRARGRVVAMTFLHAGCKSTCPVTAQTIRGALDELAAEDPQGRAEVDAMVISVDPVRDTPARVRAFLRKQHVSGWLRYMVGPRRTIEAMWKRYGIRPQASAKEEHTAFVFLVDRRGIIRTGYPAHGATADDLAHDMQLLLDERS